MAINRPNDDPTVAVRLAVLQERLGVMVESNKVWESDAKAWRLEVSAALNTTARELGKITERLEHVEEEVSELKRQLQAKVGIVYFQGFWRVMLGLFAAIATLGSFLTILKTLGVIH